MGLKKKYNIILKLDSLLSPQIYQNCTRQRIPNITTIKLTKESQNIMKNYTHQRIQNYSTIGLTNEYFILQMYSSMSTIQQNFNHQRIPNYTKTEIANQYLNFTKNGSEPILIQPARRNKHLKVYYAASNKNVQKCRNCQYYDIGVGVRRSWLLFQSQMKKRSYKAWYEQIFMAKKKPE